MCFDFCAKMCTFKVTKIARNRWVKLQNLANSEPIKNMKPQRINHQKIAWPPALQASLMLKWMEGRTDPYVHGHAFPKRFVSLPGALLFCLPHKKVGKKRHRCWKMAKMRALRAKNWQTRRSAPQTCQFLAALRCSFLHAIFQRRNVGALLYPVAQMPFLTRRFFYLFP